MSETQHKILIVGGGAAGLELATRLGKQLGKLGLAEITLQDASSSHIWKPLLHEVASGTLTESEEIEYLAQAHSNHFRFLFGKMEGLDRAAKEIIVSPINNKQGLEIIPRRRFQYDTLVMAVGSVSNTFGIKGVDQYCRFIDTTKEAFRFQKQLVETYYVQSYANQSKQRSKPLSIVIIGAGATGVELSAELHEVSKLLATYGLEGSIQVSITIIEASPQLLPALPKHLSDATLQQLDKLGIRLKLGSRVTEVTETAVYTLDGEVFEADLIVWAAGIKAPDWMKNLDGLETNHLNQLVVDQTLKTSDTAIFAMGDCAACAWVGGKGNVPPRAQAAHQQASTLAKTLINRLHAKPAIPFVYRDYGSLVSLGQYSTVGSLMGNFTGTVNVGGFIAYIMYVSLYKMHQVAIHGYFRTAMLTLSNMFRRSTHAKMKMH